jgi:hypothetical protein
MSPGKLRRRERRAKARSLKSFLTNPPGKGLVEVSSALIEQNIQTAKQATPTDNISGKGDTSKPKEHSTIVADNDPDQGRRNVRHIWCLVIDMIGFGISSILANMFLSTGPKILGVCLTYLAVFMGLFAVALPSAWFWPKHAKRIWIILSLVAFALAIPFVLWSRHVLQADDNPSPAPPRERWAPPELQPDCKTAFLHFDGDILPINLKDLQQGQPFLPAPAGVSKQMWDYAKAFFPQVVLKHNRLWVKMANGTCPISNPFDLDEVAGSEYDRNYNANAFELVNKEGVPILQVIYERPNFVAINGIFDLMKTNKAFGLWATFGTNHIFTFVTNTVERQKLMVPLKTQALFNYPFWKHPGELRIVSGPALTHSRAYEPLPKEEAALMIQKLRESHNHKVTISIHPVDPDETAYSFSEHLNSIFRYGGYRTVFDNPPAYLPQIPGVSCFLFGMAASDNGGLLEALDILIKFSGSEARFVMMPYDQGFTNDELVIMIRHR